MACRTHQWTSYMGDQMAGGRVERGVEVWGWWGHDRGTSCLVRGRVDFGAEWTGRKHQYWWKLGLWATQRRPLRRRWKARPSPPKDRWLSWTSTNIIPTYHDDHHFHPDNNYNTRRQTSAPMESFAPCLRRRWPRWARSRATTSRRWSGTLLAWPWSWSWFNFEQERMREEASVRILGRISSFVDRQKLGEIVRQEDWR